jgi:hypothetical protein
MIECPAGNAGHLAEDNDVNTQSNVPILLTTPQTPNGSGRVCLGSAQPTAEAGSHAEKTAKGVHP